MGKTPPKPNVCNRNRLARYIDQLEQSARETDSSLRCRISDRTENAPRYRILTVERLGGPSRSPTLWLQLLNLMLERRGLACSGLLSGLVRVVARVHRWVV